MDPSAPPAPAPPQLPPMDPSATTLPPVHVVHVASPTPTVAAAAAATLPSHPPYAQMITEAITALKDKSGSSKKAIAKYIDRVYSNLPGTHSALLTHHLKRLKESGQIVMVKHSYKLAGSAPQVQANGLKRGPGRPPKAKPVVNVQVQQVPQPQLQPPVNATAGPGPISVPESVFASLGLVDGPVAVIKRRPGRPRKAEAGGVGLEPNPTVVKKRPGRPPKDAAGNAAPWSAVGRPRGRPAKNAGKPRGRPPKNAAAPATVGGAAGPIPVPTGYVAETATVTAPAPPTMAAVPTLKKRGRPPKAADGPKKPRKLSGKPLGRPKKNAPTTAVQVSNLQQLMAYQELKSKLEFFQSRIKHTVGVLKPCLDGQSAASALAALQELEELAAIDVTAPLNLQSRQPPPPENQV